MSIRLKSQRRSTYDKKQALLVSSYFWRKYEWRRRKIEVDDIRLSVASIGVMERIPHTLEQEVP